MRLVIDELTIDSRIDSYLAEYMQDYSRSKIQSEIKNGAVLVNSKGVKPSYILKEGDVVEFTPSLAPEILAEDIPLEIVWEDENMVVVNKPSGMLTHPTTIETSGTLVNALLHKYGENLSDINGEFRRGILHRLDRNTSGLIMIAKNNKAHEFLVNAMKDGKMTKKYLAVVKGVIAEDEFIIDKPIGRNPNQPHKMWVGVNEGVGRLNLQVGKNDEKGVNGGGKPSRSIVRVLERLEDATLIEVQLITGRTHQIRVHMSSIGHPVYNDTLYGFGKMKIKTEEQVLQSYKLTFPRPFDGELISLEISPDEKVSKVLKTLRK